MLDYLSEVSRLRDVKEAQDIQVTKSFDLWELLKAVLIAFMIAALLRHFIFSPIVVDGTSMFPTLNNKENVLVNKAIYWLREPQRGEIVVLHAEFDSDWIKRIVGLPGDHIEIKQGKLYINDQLIEEDYVAEELFFNYGKEQHTFSIPDGYVFVMGDNREHSRDSRSIGPIQVEQVYGKAEFVYRPLSKLRWVR